MDRASLEQLQLKRLHETVRRVAAHVPFYQQKFAERGLSTRRYPHPGRPAPAALHHQRRPARDLSARACWRCRSGEPLRLHTSSGTTGKPKALFFSRQDVDNAAELCARCLVMTGVTKEDVFQNMMTYGLFTGALVMHYGAEKVGCLVIPAGPGQLRAAAAADAGFPHHRHPHHAQLRALLRRLPGKQGRRPARATSPCARPSSGAEPYTEETRRKIEQALGVRGLQLLRPLRDERPGRGLRVRAQARHAPLGGPFPRWRSSTPRPASRCPTASAANWC